MIKVTPTGEIQLKKIAKLIDADWKTLSVHVKRYATIHRYKEINDVVVTRFAREKLGLVP